MLSLSKITVRQKIIASTSLVLLVTLALGGLFVYPSINIILELNDKIYDERVELEKLYQRGQVLKKTLKEYEEVKPNLGQLDKAYVIPGQELAFFKALEQAADESGVKQSLKLIVTDPEIEATTHVFELSLQGDLRQVISHLSKLESLDYYVNIDMVRLSVNRAAYQDPNRPLSSDISATLLAKAFVKP